MNAVPKQCRARRLYLLALCGISTTSVLGQPPLSGIQSLQLQAAQSHVVQQGQLQGVAAPVVIVPAGGVIVRPQGTAPSIAPPSNSGVARVPMYIRMPAEALEVSPDTVPDDASRAPIINNQYTQTHPESKPQATVATPPKSAAAVKPEAIKASIPAKSEAAAKPTPTVQPASVPAETANIGVEFRLTDDSLMEKRRGGPSRPAALPPEPKKVAVGTANPPATLVRPRSAQSLHDGAADQVELVRPSARIQIAAPVDPKQLPSTEKPAAVAKADPVEYMLADRSPTRPAPFKLPGLTAAQEAEAKANAVETSTAAAVPHPTEVAETPASKSTEVTHADKGVVTTLSAKPPGAVTTAPAAAERYDQTRSKAEELLAAATQSKSASEAASGANDEVDAAPPVIVHPVAPNLVVPKTTPPAKPALNATVSLAASSAGSNDREPPLLRPAAFPQVGEKVQDVRLVVGENQSIRLAGLARVQVEHDGNCEALAVADNLLLVPKKAGQTRLAVWNQTTEDRPNWIQLTIEVAPSAQVDQSSAGQLQQLIRQNFKGSRVEVVATTQGLVVRGTCIHDQQARDVMQMVRMACLCPVQDKLEIYSR